MKPTKKQKLSADQLFEKRKEIIALHKKRIPIMKIVEEVGMSWPAVNTAIKRYETGGMEALQPRMGRTSGSGRAISAEQEEEIKNILYTKQPLEVQIIYQKGIYTTPPTKDEIINKISDRLINNRPCDDLWERLRSLEGDYPQHLWCRDSVKELIKQKSGIELSRRGLDKYLLRWGFPKTKQNQRPRVRCSSEIQTWLKNNPPSDESSKIYWLHRARLNTEPKRSIISATDNHRKVFWTIIRGNFSQKKQIEFLRSLSRQSRQRITVIRDNYRHYTYKQFVDWLSKSNITLQPPSLLNQELVKMTNDLDRDTEAWEKKKMKKKKAKQKRINTDQLYGIDNPIDLAEDLF